MSELGIDRQAHNESHLETGEFVLYARTAPARVPATHPSTVTESPDEHAGPEARLEHCLELQTRAIALAGGEPRAPLAPGGAELLSLLREAIRQQHALALDFRALQAQVQSLQAERDSLAIALRHTKTLSLTDELTDLPNRRAFLQRLHHELSRCQRSSQPLAMVLLDIDYFKRINDHHGHHVGDMILRCYAQSMARELRQHDLLARYGGEEFALLLPETSLYDARTAMLKLGDRIRSEPLDAVGTRLDLPTFSAGIACLRPGEPATALINRADQALYLAKRLGRDRIETDEQFSGLPPALS